MFSSISVIIPAYNSEQTLETLAARLEPVLTAQAAVFEVIMVNDGSRDRSWDVIEGLAARYSWLRGINMMRNYGQHNALLCGIRAAKGEIIVTMDDDLQHPPEEIPKILAKLNEGYDVVYGTPATLPHSLWRNLLSRLTKRAFAMAMGLSNIGDISAFRAFRARLRPAFADYRSPSLLLDVLLAWGTTRFGNVAVQHDPRRVGQSNYTFNKLVNQALLILTGFSTGPLRLASMVGLGFTALGILIFGYVIARYFLYGSVPGFPFLASTIALFSGAQLFALGIMGEYLGRIFNRSTERPVYVVSEWTVPNPLAGNLESKGIPIDAVVANGRDADFPETGSRSHYVPLDG